MPCREGNAPPSEDVHNRNASVAKYSERRCAANAYDVLVERVVRNSQNVRNCPVRIQVAARIAADAALAQSHLGVRVHKECIALSRE